ncbi:MAG: lysoplasmalogenase [Chloroflexota bacterium]
MFPYLQPAQSLWLTALLILWGLVLFGGFIFGNESETHRTPALNRMVSSILLVVAGWSWVIFCDAPEIRPFAIMIAIGMTFGFGGDLVLSELLPIGRSVIVGILFFGIGHIFYIGGIVQSTQQWGYTAVSPRLNSLILWLLIGLVGWYIVVFRGQKPTVLHWAALPYALLLAGTTGVGTGLALQEGAFVWLAVGAGLFLFSDLILAGELFADYKFRSVGDVVWLTYGPGQMLIVYSIGVAHSILLNATLAL